MVPPLLISTKYDGYSFNLDAEVDAVQTHNAKAAIKSAWGVDVSVPMMNPALVFNRRYRV